MNRIQNLVKWIIIAAGIAAVTFTGLTGCIGCGGGAADTEVQHIAVIMSNTKNEGTIDTSSFSSDISDLTMISGSTVSYFNCDGNPEYIDTLTIPEYKDKISDSKKRQLAQNYANQIISTLTGLVPDDEELDVYNAITLAARQLQNYEGEKTLYIASSGISTTGLVDFTELYLEKDHSDELAEALKNELPDLTGVKIVWFGMGETRGEQTELYESNRTILKNTWRKLLTAAGANEEDIIFSAALSVHKDERPSELPYVSVVPISCTVSDIADKDFGIEPEETADNTDESKIASNGNGTLLDLSDRVSFKPDSTELLTDRDEVAASLSGIIDYLNEDDSCGILLVGTTSSWGEEASLRQFSLKRCETIKEILVAEGVEESQIQCVGAGFDNNLTVNDRADDGSLVEELAEQNRTVYLYTNAKSPAAQKILEKFS